MFSIKPFITTGPFWRFANLPSSSSQLPSTSHFLLTPVVAIFNSATCFPLPLKYSATAPLWFWLPTSLEPMLSLIYLEEAPWPAIASFSPLIFSSSKNLDFLSATLWAAPTIVLVKLLKAGWLETYVCFGFLYDMFYLFFIILVRKQRLNLKLRHQSYQLMQLFHRLVLAP